VGKEKVVVEQEIESLRGLVPSFFAFKKGKNHEKERTIKALGGY
jgi:hypothetical protein